MDYSMNVEMILDKAYALMDQSVIEGNCGELCGNHCCRPLDEQGEKMGMYLLPYEYKYLKMKNGLKGMVVEYHDQETFELPEGIEGMYYLFCDEEKCLRGLRPIQCRTYPFEPHLVDGQLYLVIEKQQVHSCPLLVMQDEWRQAFVEGIFDGWALLLSIPKIKHYIQGESNNRNKENNIEKIYNRKTWMSMVDG